MDNPDLVYLINNFVGYEKLIKEKVDKAYKCAVRIVNESLDIEYDLIIASPKEDDRFKSLLLTILRRHGPSLRKAICLSQLLSRNLSWEQITGRGRDFRDCNFYLGIFKQYMSEPLRI